MKTAVIYARYSSERQTEQSIEGQIRACNEYAQRSDITIIETYIDRATTGTNDNRTQFQKMLKDSEKKAWEIVLVYKLDRFSRNKYEMAVHRKTLRDNGVKIVSAMENIPDTPEGVILESLLEGMAQYYSLELSQKVRRGLKESRLKGNFTGGYILYGYKVVDKKLAIDEDKAEVIRFIYQRYAEGAHVKDIIDELTEKGIYNRGKPFARNTVYNILSNTKYAGVYNYNGQIFNNIYPQIIPTPIYEIIQSDLVKNRYTKRDRDSIYLLRHKIKCGYCGQPMIAESGTSKQKIIHRYYKCADRKRGQNTCKKSVVKKIPIENLIIDTTLQLLNDNDAINILTQKILEARRKLERDQSIARLLIEEKRSTQNAINNIISAIERGITSKSTNGRLEELEAKLEKLEAQIAVEEYKEIILINEDDIANHLTFAIKQKSKIMIELLINKILLYDDKIEIFYNYTDKASPDDDSQGLFLLISSLKLENGDIFRPVSKGEVLCYF